MSFFTQASLRTKITSMVILLIVLLGAGSFYSMKQIESSYKSDLYKSFENFSITLGDGISAQFFERYGDVQAFAMNNSIQTMDGKLMQADLDTYVELYGLYEVILVVDKNGRYVGSNTKDVSGVPVNQKELAQNTYENTPWFKAAISGQFTEEKGHGFSGTFFEDPKIDSLAKSAFGEDRPMSGFTAPIRDQNGHVIGVITNRANLKWIDAGFKDAYRILSNINLLQTQMVLINKDGLVITDYEPSANGGKKDAKYDLKNTFLKRDMKKGQVPAGELLASGKSGSTLSIDDRDGGEDFVGYYHLDGDKWISAIGWGVMVMNDSKEVLQSADEAMRNFYFMFGMNVFISIVIAIFFSIALSKKVSLITQVLSKNSTEVSDASSKIASSSVELSEAATEQASALQETVAAVDEISAMVDKNAEAATRSKESSTQSREAAMRGRQNIETMLQAISDINHSNEEITTQIENGNAQLNEITKLIADIGSKTKVINEIVFQTKLLSFNASVEAARAGEYGKGFAVVAEEVGNLAQMSGNAAKEITTLLDESVQKVETIVRDSRSRMEKLMHSSREKVKTGSETAKSCNESLEEILSTVSSVDTLVSEIAVASQEQATGIREISRAVGQMEQVTQQNSSVAEMSSVSAERLRTQSVELESIVKDLAQLVNGEKGAFEAASPAVRATTNKKEKGAKVIALKPKAKPSDTAPSTVTMKKASGSDFMPSSDDPGFGE